jgi:soluble lytic murein transglycosylase-like protein
MSALVNRENLYGPILVAAFVSEGLPPEWGMAIARQESGFDPAAYVNTGGDAVRGGSRGLCQMSWLTAKGLGFLGQPEELFQPRVNADLAARLCKQLVRQFKTNDLRDIASGYNSGKPFARAPQPTQTVYAPRVVTFAMAYHQKAALIASSLPRVAVPIRALV